MTDDWKFQLGGACPQCKESMLGRKWFRKGDLQVCSQCFIQDAPKAPVTQVTTEQWLRMVERVDLMEEVVRTELCPRHEGLYARILKLKENIKNKQLSKVQDEQQIQV